MKKFFTLFALAFIAMAVNAATVEVLKYESAKELPAGIAVGGTTALANVKIHLNKDGVDCIQLKNGYTTSDAYNENAIILTPEGGFKKGDVISVAGFFNNADDSKKSAIDLFTLDGTKPTVLYTSEQFINGRTSEADPAVQTYTLTEDAATLYIGRQGNTGTNLSLILVTREGEEPGPGPEPTPGGDKEVFEAVTFNGEAYVAADVFANATISGGESVVSFGTPSMDVVAVGGTTAKDVYQDPGTEFAGWTEWNDVKWDVKNQGDIQYGYIVGTGNPAVSFTAEEVLSEGERTGHYRAAYEFYEADGSKGMPVMGLYYKFTPKADGNLAVYVWSNKGNRNTFFVDEATKQPVKYAAEGYINGQNDDEGKKKWLSAEEVQAIHDAAKVQDGVDTAPYVIGAGNQNYWGTLTIDVKAGKSYWLFQHSSQIGFQKYEFTPATTGIEEIVATPAALNNAAFNLAGQRVAANTKGLVIINGKKYLNK